MLLSRLTEDEKKGFLILAKKASEANGEIAAEEKALLRDYCREMELEEVVIEDIPEIEMDKLVAGFCQSEKTHQRIVLFELLGLMYADGSYDEVEQGFVREFAERIGFEKNEIKEHKELIEQYVSVVSTISKYILL